MASDVWDALMGVGTWWSGEPGEGEQYGESQHHTYLRTLRVFANWLARPPQCYCRESPLRYLRLPHGDRPPHLAVDADVLQRMLAVADLETVDGVRTQAMLLTVVDGGVCAKELASLTIGDVSLQDGMLLVRRAKCHQPRLVVVGQETVLARCAAT